MDLSKLPKLSQTPGQTETPESPTTGAALTSPVPAKDFCRQCGLPLRPGARFCDGCGGATGRADAPMPGAGADAWLSIAMGVILLLVNPTMMKYVASKLFGTSFVPFTLPDGTEVPYPKVYPQFFSDFCITLFAVALIVEAIALVLVRKPLVLWLAFFVTVAMVLLNLAYVVMTMSQYGLPIISIVAVAFGVYIAIQQWANLRAMRD